MPKLKVAVSIAVVTSALLAASMGATAEMRVITLPGLPTIVGIQLGKPLTLPDCLRSSSGLTPLPTTTFVCVDRGSPHYEYEEPWFMLPEGGAMPASLQRGGRIHLADGIIDEIMIWTHGVEGQDEIMGLLTEKFGKPTSQTSRAVQNRMGAQYQSILAKWMRAGFVVTYDATWSDLDNGTIVVETAAHAAAEAGKPKPSL